jgi:hypothetical protein
MPAGSSVIYRVRGPISSCRVYTFAAEPDTRLEISVSSDGMHFEPVTAVRQAFSAGPGPYGYLEPVLYQLDSVGDGQTYLRLAVGQGSEAGSGQGGVSQTEASHRAKLETSRVEIEYGIGN